MRLIDLPSDILFILLDKIWPDDLLNFVLSCSIIYAHAVRRLAIHKAYISQYSRVKIDVNFIVEYDTNASKYVIPHACSLLYDIQEDSYVRYYVRRIDFYPASNALAYDNKDSDENVSKLYQLDLENMLSPWMTDRSKRDEYKEVILRRWEPHLGGAEGGAAFVLLLSMLPSLNYIGLHGHFEDYSRYLQELLLATMPWKEDKMKPLQKVTYIYIQHWDTEGGIPLKAIGNLIRLPNLRELECFAIGDWTEDVDPPPSDGKISWTSPITTLILKHSFINPGNLASFIRPMGKLQLVIYEDTRSMEEDDDDEIEEFLKAFIAIAHEWLEEHGLVASIISMKKIMQIRPRNLDLDDE